MPMAAGGNAPAPMAPLGRAWDGLSSPGTDPVVVSESSQGAAHHDIYAVGLTAIFILSLFSIGMTVPSVGRSTRQPRQGSSVTSVFSPNFHSLT